jgi:hypothetical protein
MTKDADTQMKINYEDFDDEFAKISLEITAAAEKAKASGKPQFLVRIVCLVLALVVGCFSFYLSHISLGTKSLGL